MDLTSLITASLLVMAVPCACADTTYQTQHTFSQLPPPLDPNAPSIPSLLANLDGNGPPGGGGIFGGGGGGFFQTIHNGFDKFKGLLGLGGPGGFHLPPSFGFPFLHGLFGHSPGQGVGQSGSIWANKKSGPPLQGPPFGGPLDGQQPGGPNRHPHNFNFAAFPPNSASGNRFSRRHKVRQQGVSSSGIFSSSQTVVG